jgi:hypothetical protein
VVASKTDLGRPILFASLEYDKALRITVSAYTREHTDRTRTSTNLLQDLIFVGFISRDTSAVESFISVLQMSER